MTPVVDPADEVLAAVNDARTAAGCASLTADAGLTARATEHSAAKRDDDSSVDRGGLASAVAEGTVPTEVADDLLDDDTLLDCALTTAGVGTADGLWTFLAT